MELIPHEEIKGSREFNSAPMIDFLFLMLALFATLAISRASLYDSEIELASLKPEAHASPLRSGQTQQINLSITKEGQYKWLTEFQQYPIASTAALQEELSRQYQIGALPKDKAKTEVLLHIDRMAPWQPIAEAIFAIRELGFRAHPLYEEETEPSKL
jgi:biopolymer transport protein ExbD